jgi:hypothetical protein
MPEWVQAVGPVLIALFCFGALAAGLWLLVEAARFRCAADRSVGEVVRVHSQWQDVTRTEDGGSRNERLLVHYPVIAFEDSDGARHEVRADIGSPCAPGYRVGQRVPVLFRRGDPQSMRIDSFTSLWGNAACMLFIAAAGALVLAFWLGYVP